MREAPESLSDVPVLFSREFARRLVRLSKAKTAGQKAKAFAGFRPGELAPHPPAIAEYTTGLSMGESAEKMAKENGIPREAQDQYALDSHRKAATGWDGGILGPEVVPVALPPKFERMATTDNIIRRDSSLEQLAKLPPVFDRKFGTVTAGNSSPLTDGASAVLLMSEERAKAQGRRILAFIRSWAYAGVDPGEQLLQGPAYAAPIALDRAGLKLSDIGRVEMHEAFAAQVLSNLQAFASEKFAREKLGRSAPIGSVDPRDPEPVRRLDRHRASLRSDGSADRHDSGQRARPFSHGVRTLDRLRRGRARARDGAGARMNRPASRRLFTASLLLALALTSWSGAETPRRRAVLVSFDALAGERLQELLAQPGKLAFGGFRRIAERGFVASRSVPPSPALTAVSHITIATGALPAATGIVSNWMLDRSKPFGKTISGFDAPIRAETLWEAAHRQGKRVGVVLFPGADGKAPGRRADWALTWPDWPPLYGVRQRLAAADWRPGETVERSFSTPRRHTFALGSSGHAFTAIAIDATDDGRVDYDHVRVEPESGVTADVSPGSWFAVEVKASEGRTGAWCKLLSLASDLSSAEIYVGPLNRNVGYPREFLREVDERIGFWPGAGDDKAFGGRSDHPEVFYEQLDRLADFLTRAQLLAIARSDWDLLLLYQPEVDSLSHVFWLTDPAQPGFTWERAAEFRRFTDRAYELADRSLDSLERALSPNDGIFVTSDHGMTPIWTEIYPNELLRHAGLLRVDAGGKVDPSSAAFAACDGAIAHVYRNAGTDPAIVTQIAALFAQFRLQGESPFETILRREDAGPLGLDAPESGDLIVFGKPGVHFARGLPKEPSPVGVPAESGTHGYMNHHTQIQAAFLAAGPGIAHEKTETIRSWEIAAWVCKLLEIEPPRDAARAGGSQPFAR